MSGLVDKYLGIMLIILVMFWLFKDANATTSIFSSLSDANTNAIRALQGR
jgi:Fe2+ transport system protein B